MFYNFDWLCYNAGVLFVLGTGLVFAVVVFKALRSEIRSHKRKQEV